jgi:hypothetical protein
MKIKIKKVETKPARPTGKKPLMKNGKIVKDQFGDPMYGDGLDPLPDEDHEDYCIRLKSKMNISNRKGSDSEGSFYYIGGLKVRGKQRTATRDEDGNQTMKSGIKIIKAGGSAKSIAKSKKGVKLIRVKKKPFKKLRIKRG